MTKNDTDKQAMLKNGASVGSVSATVKTKRKLWTDVYYQRILMSHWLGPERLHLLEHIYWSELPHLSLGLINVMVFCRKVQPQTSLQLYSVFAPCLGADKNQHRNQEILILHLVTSRERWGAATAPSHHIFLNQFIKRSLCVYVLRALQRAKKH